MLLPATPPTAAGRTPIATCTGTAAATTTL